MPFPVILQSHLLGNAADYLPFFCRVLPSAFTFFHHPRMPFTLFSAWGTPPQLLGPNNLSLILRLLNMFLPLTKHTHTCSMLYHTHHQCLSFSRSEEQMPPSSILHYCTYHIGNLVNFFFICSIDLFSRLEHELFQGRGYLFPLYIPSKQHSARYIVVP